MDEPQAVFQDTARRALREYSLGDPSLTFLQHSDNVTYRVESPDAGAFLLRIHVPVTVALGTHGADSDALNSELLWLEALGRETDLVLPRPARNRAGALVTTIPAGEAGAPVHCTLLHWVEGRPYHRDLQTEATAGQIGTILARLHRHASQWELPPGFRRPRRDGAYFEGVLRGLRPAVEDGRISPSDFAALETSIALLLDLLRSTKESRQTHGIMHADMHKGNMLYYEGEIRLIDFSFCAFGDFMFDLGIALGDMPARLHRACLDGYQSRRALPAGYPRLVEAFFLGSIVGTFSFWVGNPRAQQLLAAKVPEIVRDYAMHFNRGESFWFSS